MKEDLIEVKPRMKFERWALVERSGGYSLWIDKPSKASSVDAFAIKHIDDKKRITVTRWIVVWPSEASAMYYSKPDPVDLGGAFAIKEITIEVEEGEGLDAV
jgi:hypothetical protein